VENQAGKSYIEQTAADESLVQDVAVEVMNWGPMLSYRTVMGRKFIECGGSPPPGIVLNLFMPIDRWDDCWMVIDHMRIIGWEFIMFASKSFSCTFILRNREGDVLAAVGRHHPSADGEIMRRLILKAALEGVRRDL
jgi:hypothetical protein